MFLLEEIVRNGAVKFGRFQLKSGQIADTYIDLRCLRSRPELMRSMADEFWRLMDVPYDFIADVPTGSTLLVGAIMAIYGASVVTPVGLKAHGDSTEVLGIYQPGQVVAVIEDTVTTGGSLVRAVETLRRNGLVVTDAYAFIDREQGATENLAKTGCRLRSVYTLSDVRRCMKGT